MSGLMCVGLIAFAYAAAFQEMESDPGSNGRFVDQGTRRRGGHDGGGHDGGSSTGGGGGTAGCSAGCVTCARQRDGRYQCTKCADGSTTCSSCTVVTVPNNSAQAAVVIADGSPPNPIPPSHDGWTYTKPSLPPNAFSKINWYFYGNTANTASTYGALFAPGGGFWVVLSVNLPATTLPFFQLYTAPTGTGDYVWYHTRQTYYITPPTTDGTPYLYYIGADPRARPCFPFRNVAVGTVNAVADSSNYGSLDSFGNIAATSIVRYITIHSDSAATLVALTAYGAGATFAFGSQYQSAGIHFVTV